MPLILQLQLLFLLQLYGMPVGKNEVRVVPNQATCYMLQDFQNYLRHPGDHYRWHVESRKSGLLVLDDDYESVVVGKY